MTRYQPAPDTTERYLQGKLREAEVVEFELWLADHPDEMEVLELDLLMQEGLQSGHIGDDQVKPHQLINNRKNRAWLWASPLLLLALLTGYLLHQGIEDDLEHSLANALYVPVEVMRGSSEVQAEIYLGGADQDLVLMLPELSAEATMETLQLKLDDEVMQSGYRLIRENDQRWVVLRRDRLTGGQVLSVAQSRQNGALLFKISYALVE